MENWFEEEKIFLEQDEINLRDYWRIILKRKNVILTFFIITVALVTIYTFSETPLYQGTCKVVIERNATERLANSYYGYNWDPEFLKTQIEIIKSPRVALRVVEMLNLEDTWERYLGREKDTESIFEPVKEFLRELENSIKSYLSPGGNTTGQENIRPALSKKEMLAIKIASDITITPIRETRLVVISFLSLNPQLAALVANSTAKAYIETMLNMRMEARRRTLGWMTRKASEEAKKVRDAEEKLHHYMEANDIVTLENKLTILPQKLSELSSQLVKAQTEFEDKKALYQMINRIGNNMAAADTIPAIANNGALQTLNEQIVLSDKNIMTLSRKYGRKHPVMKKAVSDLALLKRKRREQIVRCIQAIKNDYELARKRLENLRQELAKTKKEALRINEKFIQYSTLKREVETTRKLYDALMVKIEEKGITEETQPVNLEVVERAQIPSGPSSPRKMRNILLAVILGLFGGTGLAFFLEYIDDTVSSPEDAERILQEPILGTIPFSEDRKRDQFALASHDVPNSPLAESFRALRASILLSSAEHPPGTILVTSAGAGEGKTTVASNLAYIMAQTDKKVLLIDADLRKPRIHKVFSLDNRVGLSNCLAGAMEKIPFHRGFDLDGMKIITSGPVPPNPSELLASDRMLKLIETARDQFDFIIVDSAPLLSVADSIILAKYVDSTIFVTKAHESRFEVVKKALKSLRDVNSRVAGMVINALKIKEAGYYYQYYYGHYGHYGDNPDGDARDRK